MKKPIYFFVFSLMFILSLCSIRTEAQVSDGFLNPVLFEFSEKFQQERDYWGVDKEALISDEMEIVSAAQGSDSDGRYLRSDGPCSTTKVCFYITNVTSQRSTTDKFLSTSAITFTELKAAPTPGNEDINLVKSEFRMTGAITRD